MGLGGGMGWMWVFWLLLLVGLVLHGRAREILDERYARGELTTDGYRARVRALGGPGSAADQ